LFQKLYGKVALFVTLVRGLMARGHASVVEFEARLQQLLDSDEGERALAVAASYAVLVNDDVQAVSAASSAVCVLLWQQVQAWLQLLACQNFALFIDVSLSFLCSNVSLTVCRCRAAVLQLHPGFASSDAVGPPM
jgi:hypothetical protein